MPLSDAPDSPLFSPLVRRFRPRAAKRVLLLSIVAWAAACVTGSLLHAGSDVLAVLAVLTILAPLGLLLAYFTRGGQATLTRHDEQLVIAYRERKEHLSLRDFRAGFLRPSRDGVELELYAEAGRVLSAQLRTLAEGEAFLTLLGLSPEQRSLRIQPRSLAARLVAAMGGMLASYFASNCLLGMLGFTRWYPLATVGLSLVLPLVGLVFSLYVLRPPRFTVGSDGLELDTWKLHRFFHYRHIRALEYTGSKLVLHRVDRPSITVWDPLVTMDPALSTALVHRVQLMLQHHAERPDARAQLLARQGRSLQAWRAYLRTLTQRNEHYRHGGLDRETLRSILSNPNTPLELRLGAALCLSEELPERVRVEAAAQASAHEDVRVVLHKLAQGDSSQLEEALEVVLAEELPQKA